MRLLINLILMATMLLSGCGAIQEVLPTYEESSIVAVGDKAPDFTATTIKGESITLSELDNEATLLVLFSHTCPDCKALFDDLMLYKSDIDAMGARVIAISRGGTKSEITEYMERNGYDFDAVADSNKEIYYQYATAYVPRTYLIDKDGFVVNTTIEYKSEHLPQIVALIEALVK